jgi:Ca2+-binding EF-hand superfamily protein
LGLYRLFDHFEEFRVMNKFLLCGAAAVATAVGSAAIAATAPPAKPAPRAHKAMQTELRTDVQGHVAKMFARLDTNKDGFITQAELDAGQAQRAAKIEKRAERFDPAKLFARLDTNKDGKITEAEADAVHNARVAAKGGKPGNAHTGGLFARLDTNKDKVVTRAEFDTAAAQMHARIEQAGVHRGGADKLLEAADSNKDGRVSLAEVQQMALQHFDRADLNHDDKLTPDERRQSRQQMKTQHKPS